MVYELRRRVSHAEVDFLGELKLSALLGLFEQAAVEASGAAGYDARRYAAERRVWLIRRTLVSRWLPVGGTDELRIRTRVADVRRARSLREYAVQCNGKLVAEGVTDWVYCDLESRRPARIPPQLASALSSKPEVPSFERAPSPPDDPEGEAVTLLRPVAPSDLDHVGHMNNALYANALEDGAFLWFQHHAWPLERMLAHGGALRPVTMDIEYFADAGAGDTLRIDTWGEPPQGSPKGVPCAVVLWQRVRSAEGQRLVHAASVWQWRYRSPVLGEPPLAW